MKILIPFFTILGTNSYPDDFRLFSGMEVVSVDGVEYWLTDYRGDLPLENGAHTFADYEAAQARPLYGITVASMSGLIAHNADFTRATCAELTDVMVMGNAGVPSQSFSMPVRRDDGRLFLFPVTTGENGDFVARLNFPTTGQFSYGAAEANIDLPYTMFNLSTYRFDVVRNVSA